MHDKLLISGLLASVIIVPALAQSNPPATNQPPAATQTPTDRVAPAPAPAQSQAHLWRASKIKGLNVYNEQNEKLGDINEILIDKSGKIEGIVIGVGGFLGLGEHDIKVEMNKLKFVDEPVRTSSNSANNNGTTGSANRSSNTTSSSSNASRWSPDHAVMSGASKDQLKGMPQFKYD